MYNKPFCMMYISLVEVHCPTIPICNQAIGCATPNQQICMHNMSKAASVIHNEVTLLTSSIADIEFPEKAELFVENAIDCPTEFSWERRNNVRRVSFR